MGAHGLFLRNWQNIVKTCIHLLGMQQNLDIFSICALVNLLQPMCPCYKYKQILAWNLRGKNSNGMNELQIEQNNFHFICSYCGNNEFGILQLSPFPFVWIQLPFLRLIQDNFRHLSKKYNFFHWFCKMFLSHHL